MITFSFLYFCFDYARRSGGQEIMKFYMAYMTDDLTIIQPYNQRRLIASADGAPPACWL